MKKILLLVCFITCAHLINAQNYPYCKPGLFSEQNYYNNVALVEDYDVQYGANFDLNGIWQDLKMDIHYPNMLIDPLPQRPLVVMIHGGGFSSGNKSDMTNYCNQLARKGYVAVSIDYRLGWDYIGGGGNCNGNISQLHFAIYRALQDVKASLRFLISKWADYRIDTNNIFLAGQSEGGLLAINAGYLNQAEANNLLPGAYADLGSIDSASNTLHYNISLKGIFNWCGAIMDTNIIDTDTWIPVLNIHGLKDSVMPAETGPYLYCNNIANPYPVLMGPLAIFNRMKNLGICSEANFDANGAHCIYPSLEEVVYIPSKFTCFFKNLLCGNCNTESKVSYNFHSCVEAAPLAVGEQLVAAGIQLTPNPASTWFNISFDLPKANGVIIKLLEVSGRPVLKIFEGDLNRGVFNQRFTFQRSMAKGLYFVEIRSGQAVEYRKILIQ